MLLIDIKDKELTQEEVEMLEHPLVSGLILFTRNFYDKAQIQALVKSIRQRVKKPLLITVDQEGGRVQRFREGFTKLPAMQSFNQLATTPEQAMQLAKETGWLMAAEMFCPRYRPQFRSGTGFRTRMQSDWRSLIRARASSDFACCRSLY